MPRVMYICELTCRLFINKVYIETVSTCYFEAGKELSVYDKKRGVLERVPFEEAIARRVSVMLPAWLPWDSKIESVDARVIYSKGCEVSCQATAADFVKDIACQLIGCIGMLYPYNYKHSNIKRYEKETEPAEGGDVPF